jgi:hypothetical protein
MQEMEVEPDETGLSADAAAEKTETIELEAVQAPATDADQSQPKRKVPCLLGAPMISTPAAKKVKSTSTVAERLLLPQVRIKLSSPIWSISPRGFNKYVDPKLSVYTICNECIHEGNTHRAELLCGVDRSPTNARHHLQAHHAPIYDSLLQEIALAKQVSLGLYVACSHSFINRVNTSITDK